MKILICPVMTKMIFQAADFLTHMDTSSGIPPLDNVVPTSEPIISDTQFDLTSQSPMKRCRIDPRVRLVFPDPIQTTETPPSTTFNLSSSVPTQENPNSIHEASGSSVGLR